MQMFNFNVEKQSDWRIQVGTDSKLSLDFFFLNRKIQVLSRGGHLLSALGICRLSERERKKNDSFCGCQVESTE